MGTALVTGAAGFVGSHLVERLVRDGWTVKALDCLTSYYDRSQKASNLEEVARSGAEILDHDLRRDDLTDALADVDVVFHQAGQPGVRDSWAQFASYVEHNVLATQRLLEAVRTAGCRRLVYASSSSVYGDALSYPTEESALPRPQSPYGVTKLSAEHLCGVYSRNFGVPTVALRYFTVFGPRQRPDMAMHRLFEAALTRRPFPRYGSGEQIRDFTFVSDVVEANVRAATAEVPGGTVLNIAGGSSVSLNTVIDIVGDVIGSPVPIEVEDRQAGDVDRTGGAIGEAARILGWVPEVSVEEGLARQGEWHLGRSRVRA